MVTERLAEEGITNFSTGHNVVVTMIAVHKITICAEEETVLDDVITGSHAYCCLVSYLVFAIVVIAYLAQVAFQLSANR